MGQCADPRRRSRSVGARAFPGPSRCLRSGGGGHRLRIADGEQTLDNGAVPVAVVALFASLSGWGLLAAPERFAARRAPAIWTGVAVAVLAGSFLPLLGDGMDGGTRVSLALMHLAVAAVLIPGLGGRLPGRAAGAAGG
ncbi:DUF6069 family protein [Streptomyces massasporeus]|uniref:DUF6069 family protein n=1 Tax=Streptomyces massasporeus TaxID=67324 RepID=UPI0036FBC03B